MSSRRPVNKVSSRLRPSDSTPDSTSDAAERTVRRRTAQRPASRSRAGEARSARPAAEKEPADEAPSRRFGRRPASGPGRKGATARARTGGPGKLRSLRTSWGLVSGMLVAAVLLSAFAAVACFRPGVADGNQAYVDTAATQEVTAAADNALKTIYSTDAENIGGYKDAVHKVVTGKMLTDFDKFADTTISAVQQAQSTAQANPDPIGVTLLTDDRAELLVNLTVSATKDNVPQESASGPIVLHMQKVDGHWLASEIADR
ncbi:hypothetical protein [Nocardia sp. BMG51109]|uniref:hypothetical protein n=1 Tax=Nocardia sp. BMG51109 TaxID=1056816 RepID=UPI000467097E|nr:hypothetical protein [Nocardia sp. BMG51109]